MKKWFTGLKVSQKLMLISIFFVMPDCLMLYFFITGINANIRFAQLEKKGNEYQRPLEELLELIPQHRALVPTAIAGQPRFSERLVKKQAQIDTAFGALEAVDARLGAELQFTDEGLAKRKREHYRVRTVRTEWQELKTQLAQLQPEACAAQHLHLITDLRTMITHVGDLSNLILDPDLDSYYLMDTTLLALPQTQDRLAAIMTLGAATLSRQTISTLERQQLAIHAAELKEVDLDRIIGSLQTALNEDSNFYGSSATLQARVPPALKEYTAAARQFISLTTRLASSESIGVTPEDYWTAGSKARAASFKLWKIADEELDTLIQTRIAHYEHRRALSLMVAAFALLAAIILVTFITRSISGPLRKQAADLRTANDTLQAEITERNRTEKELEKTHKELLEASRQAGMAEVATSVLHNVGNVLNSVNIASSCVADTLRKSKVVTLLREHEQDFGDFFTNNPKGRQVPVYLAQLAGHLAGEQAHALKELAQLQKNIEHIKDIVTMQQSFAKPSGVTEMVNVAELVEDALSMDSSGLARHDIQVFKEFNDTPLITVEKHKVLQILVNLVHNAKHACDASELHARKLTIRTTNGEDRVRIVVGDNGVGIPPENLVRIFSHGFSTKTDGHGFGLHSGALAAREMGGSLTVHSDGPGQGAEFTLELPTMILAAKN